MKHEGWDDVFLDIDAGTGIAAGERWERALTEAASRCEAVLFLISRAWLASRWCLKEFELAYRLNKRLFGLLLEDIPQRGFAGQPHPQLATRRAPFGRRPRQAASYCSFYRQARRRTFSEDALRRLKTGLQRAGLDSRFFAWPPKDDPDRPPYRGLRPLEAEDAGIFFGRDAFIEEFWITCAAFATPPHLAFLSFSAHPAQGSLHSYVQAYCRGSNATIGISLSFPSCVRNAPSSRAKPGFCARSKARMRQLKPEYRGSTWKRPLKMAPQSSALSSKRLSTRQRCFHAISTWMQRQPTLILPIDQAEELFHAEAQDEAIRFLRLLDSSSPILDTPSITAVFTIRSDNYERLQLANELQDIRAIRDRPAARTEGSLRGGHQGARTTAGRNQPQPQDRRELSSMRCLPTWKPATPQTLSPCSRSRWNDFTRNTIPVVN